MWILNLILFSSTFKNSVRQAYFSSILSTSTGDLRRMSVSFRRPTNRKGNNGTETHAVAKKLPAGWSHGNTSQAVFYSVGNIWCKM
jgi:hypothetical protein